MASSTMKRKHDELVLGTRDDRHINTIVIHGVPTNVNFSLLSNALGLYISQAFCWSLKFFDGTFPSECIEMYTYDNMMVGRLRLRPQRSHYQRSAFHSYSIVHAERTGILELIDRGTNCHRYYSRTVASVLNDVVAKQPLLVTAIDGTVVKARSLLFESEDDPFFTGQPQPIESTRRRALNAKNGPTEKKSQASNKKTYVSMLTTATNARHPPAHANILACSRDKRAMKVSAPGKENAGSHIAAVMATNSGDTSTKQKHSLHEPTLRRSENSKNHMRSRYESRARKTPLGVIAESQEN